jgi:hypothetical protein
MWKKLRQILVVSISYSHRILLGHINLIQPQNFIRSYQFHTATEFYYVVSISYSHRILLGHINFIHPQNFIRSYQFYTATELYKVTGGINFIQPQNFWKFNIDTWGPIIPSYWNHITNKWLLDNIYIKTVPLLIKCCIVWSAASYLLCTRSMAFSLHKTLMYLNIPWAIFLLDSSCMTRDHFLLQSCSPQQRK